MGVQILHVQCVSSEYVSRVWPGDQDGGLGAVHTCCYVNTTHVVEDLNKSISTDCSQENEDIQPNTSFVYSCDSQ